MQNMESVINDDPDKKIRIIDKRLSDLQIELIGIFGDKLAAEKL